MVNSQIDYRHPTPDTRHSTPDTLNSTLNASSIPLLYEDNHLLVVVKPSGVPTQADRTGEPDMLTRLKADLKRRHEKPGNVFLGLVHRLDRPVGGVMVFAKTSKAASRLSAQIRARTFEKVYLAQVHGVPEPREGELVDFLLKDQRSNTVRVAAATEPGAKQARLAYRVEKAGGEVSLVRIELHTGRPHQVRVQMAAIGCPLVGDRKYGDASSNSPGEAIALWAYEIRFNHPTRGETVCFTVDPPW